MALRRLDAELVRRQIARSRDEAKELIEARQVVVNGIVADKAARQVADDASIAISGSTQRWVSRGAHKLLSAIDAFAPLGLNVKNRRCLDAGASTGGFTQVLLEHGAAEVVAVDVGYGQLHWTLRTDARVTVVDRCNIRYLRREQIGDVVDLVVADVSFISLTLVLPALVQVTTATADVVVMVKPQFEVGPARIGPNGVVTDAEARAWAVAHVAQAALDLGWGTRALAASALPGPAGNHEFFLWLHRDAEPVRAAMIAQVVEGVHS